MGNKATSELKETSALTLCWYEQYMLQSINSGNVTTLKRLLHSSEVDINVPVTKTGNKYLIHMAAQLNMADCLNVLLEAEADIDAVDNSLETPLHLAAECGSTECAKVLIDGGAHRECRDLWERTPLLKAIVNRHYGIAQLLLESGVSVNAADTDKKVPLHVAASYGNLRLLKRLLRADAMIDYQDLRGRTALYFAVLSGHNHIIKHLISSGCNVSMCRKCGPSPLCIAIKKQNLIAVRMLLEAGATTIINRLKDGTDTDDELIRLAMRQMALQQSPVTESYEIIIMVLSAHGLPPSQKLIAAALQLYKQQPDGLIRFILCKLIAASGQLTFATHKAGNESVHQDNYVHVPLQNLAAVDTKAILDLYCMFSAEHGFPRIKTLLDQSRCVLRESFMLRHNVIWSCNNLGLPRLLKEILLLQRI